MPAIPRLLRREGRRDDLLACFYFYVSATEDEDLGSRTWNRLEGSAGRLERQIMEYLVEQLDMPVKVSVFFRRGRLEITALVLGTYTVLKDYKVLRDSLTSLKEDVVDPFLANYLDDGQGWDVDATVWTPGTPGSEALVGGARMDLGSRYAFLYLMISNLVLIIFLGLLFLLVLRGSNIFDLTH